MGKGKKLKKEVQEVLEESLNLTLSGIDETAARKMKKSLVQASKQLASKFSKTSAKLKKSGKTAAQELKKVGKAIAATPIEETQALKEIITT